MGSFIKNLKSLFIIEEENNDVKKSFEPQEKQKDLSGSSEGGPNITEGDSKGQVDKKFLDILLNSLQESNQQGFDYLEYKQSLQSLRKMDMDEQTRYQSAFAMAQTMGATPASLRQTGEIYLKILKSEEEKFKQSLIHQRKTKIDDKKATLDNVDKWIATKEAEIAKIREQIEKKAKSKSKIEEDMKRANQKIQTVQSNFMTTYNHLIQQINEDLEKIKRYLK